VTEKAMYKLQTITDNPLFEGFGFVRHESIRGKSIRGHSRLDWDFLPDDLKTKGRQWCVTRLAPFWTPQAVTGRVRAFNDYPCVNLVIPAFSRRAVDALRDLVEPNGELLPLVSRVGEYYAYNITTVADVLDLKQSEIQWMDNRHIFALSINRYECHGDRMEGLSIFRLVEHGAAAFVTQVFVDRVREHNLRGFHFVKLWPLRKDITWRQVESEQLDNAIRISTPEGRVQIKGNTVVLLLPYEKEDPSAEEKARVAKIVDEIDDLLYDPAAAEDAPYFGSLEGNEHFEGSFRLFLSCPDADALVEKLRPWLEGILWPGGVHVLKRYGPYGDAECREEYVSL
jgi:hypothetical protein